MLPSRVGRCHPPEKATEFTHNYSAFPNIKIDTSCLHCNVIYSVVDRFTPESVRELEGRAETWAKGGTL